MFKAFEALRDLSDDVEREDGAGNISFLELQNFVRLKLGLMSSSVTDLQLKGLWRRLDADGSGMMDAQEFGKFMRKGTE